jgi:hypothetical protein
MSIYCGDFFFQHDTVGFLKNYLRLSDGKSEPYARQNRAESKFDVIHDGNKSKGLVTS